MQDDHPNEPAPCLTCINNYRCRIANIACNDYVKYVNAQYKPEREPTPALFNRVFNLETEL